MTPQDALDELLPALRERYRPMLLRWLAAGIVIGALGGMLAGWTASYRTGPRVAWVDSGSHRAASIRLYTEHCKLNSIRDDGRIVVLCDDSALVRE